MKAELFIVYVAHEMYAFGNEADAGSAAAALSRGYRMTGAADPHNPNCKIEMAALSPRLERVVWYIPRRLLRLVRRRNLPQVLPAGSQE